jgi:hypothetical protein
MNETHWGRVEMSEIPQALHDVGLRIEAAEELLAALEAIIAQNKRLRDELRAEYRKAVVVVAKKYLERLDDGE